LEQLAAVDTSDAATLLAVTEKRAKLEGAAIRATIKANGAKAKEDQDKFIAYFKALDAASKQDYYDLRDKRFDRVLAHIPADTITTALAAITAIEKAAKPSKKKEATSPI
jgi:DNA-binding GntR family transcriptional regulator